ncbi:amidohydrolase [Pacificimonas flava]|uniref:Amidohydrolase n=2 Tax=Pacificimonas TaxID=1960290 RepID=A0A219B6U8_9SPHN|nr:MULTISPECIES: amidohydrolase [Pacificimonas]MBZ6379282.1 amidohydrolase [Pacificimonas aurantium]OWV33508.1 amidohydrolase [Pacificimonas flava]
MPKLEAASGRQPAFADRFDQPASARARIWARAGARARTPAIECDLRDFRPALPLAALAFLAAAALFLALLPAGPAAARTIIVNANGYTFDGIGRLQHFTTLIIGDDGRVEGTRDAGDAYPDGTVIDADGATLLPGLIDAHGHVMGLGESLLSLDLSGTSSLEQALEALRAYADANPDLPWITGRGWNQVTYGMADFPTAADLDAVVRDRPVVLERVDGHATWANSEALARAGITAATPDPDGGHIVRLPDGSPAGVLVDTASAPLKAAIPAPTAMQRAARLQAALAVMAKAGMTAAADMGTAPEDFAIMRQFAEEGRLTARIASYSAGMDALAQIAPDGPTGWMYRDRLGLLGVKLYVDGALGSRGAALLAPYSDAPGTSGLFITSGATLRNRMALAAQQGHQLAVHAIGDAANREVLDSLADIQDYVPLSRPRIEHAQVIAPEDIARFSGLGVIASVQPTHATSDKAMAEDRIGADRLEGAYAWRTLASSGARLALGSDFPVEPVPPLYGLHAAVTREDRAGQPPGGWIAEESLQPGEALAGFTTGAAYAMQLEGSVGTLSPGKWADFVLLSGDPVAGDPEEIWSLQVLETWVAGERVYRADQ